MKTLEMQELQEINGGFSWRKFLSGAIKTIGGVAAIVTTGGAAAIPGGLTAATGVAEIVDGARD